MSNKNKSQGEQAASEPASQQQTEPQPSATGNFGATNGGAGSDAELNGIDKVTKGNDTPTEGARQVQRERPASKVTKVDKLNGLTRKTH